METKRTGDLITLEVNPDEAEVIHQLATEAAQSEQAEYDVQLDSGGEQSDEIEVRLLILDEISNQVRKILN
jgi:hypothetical protein